MSDSVRSSARGIFSTAHEGQARREASGREGRSTVSHPELFRRRAAQCWSFRTVISAPETPRRWWFLRGAVVAVWGVSTGGCRGAVEILVAVPEASRLRDLDIGP